MPSTADMILLTGVFALLFVSLILLIVLGAESFQQFNKLGDALSSAFNGVLVTLEQVTSSILQSLQAFADTAVQVFKGTAATIGTSFTNVTQFFEDEFAGAISDIGSTSVRLSAQVTRTLSGGLIGAANGAAQLLQALQYLVLQITQLVATSIVSAVSFIFTAISAGFNFLLRAVVGIVGCVLNPMICGLNCLRQFFGLLYCNICAVCCFVPFVTCILGDVQGPSCCGVQINGNGCGHCGANQFNICANPGALVPAIPLIGAACIFGSFTCPC